MEWWRLLILLVAGAIAGFINSMAGGGSLVTLPMLMLYGLPPDAANGTNRLGILVQAITSFVDYHRSGVKVNGRTSLLLIPLCAGACAGALTVNYVPHASLNLVIVCVMLLSASFLFIQPSKWNRPLGSLSTTFVRNPLAWISLLVAGFYAGFIQVGVNFVILIILVFWGGFDLLHANAFKQLAQFAFTLLILPVFIANGKVAWLPGLFLSCGSAIGSWVGAHLAVKKGAKLVRWLLVIAIVIFAIKQIIDWLQ